MTDKTTATVILNTARTLITLDRQQMHGDAREDFTRTGKMWAAVLGQAGVSYLTSKADLLRTIAELDDAGLAVTEGTVTAPTMPDARVPLYQVGWPLSRTVVLPAGNRCTEYRVTCIYADVPIADYGVAQRKLSELH